MPLTAKKFAIHFTAKILCPQASKACDKASLSIVCVALKKKDLSQGDG